jgi:hypothetical protein
MNDSITRGPDQEVTCRFTEIFKRQRDLMARFDPIEEVNGLCQTRDVPVNINDRFGQARLKDFAWRITEELCEANDILEWHGYQHAEFQEELIDAFHFLVELAILSDLAPDQIIQLIDAGVLLDESYGDFLESWFASCEMPLVGAHPTLPQVQEEIHNVIFNLGMSMNLLKLRPWKQKAITHTNSGEYHLKIAKTFEAFAQLLFTVKLTPQHLYDWYFQKSNTNHARIDAGI